MINPKLLRHTIAYLATILLCSCATQSPVRDQKPSAGTPVAGIKYEKYTLENGLDVVLHIDRSDPVVAINIAAHVGSGRELPGRTGFAHLFEHLLFLDSENLGYGGLDEMNTRIGGEGTNGFTTTDLTQYFQAVPADALEKVIWAEADKLGYFINTVTQAVIDNEKQVVKNEKRQRVDNQPYGHANAVIGRALYPQDHPYNWQVIGSLADLDAATLEDTKEFYRRWYVPNNVTLTLSGDFDVSEAKRLVEKYFAEIPRGPDVANMQKRPSPLSANKSFYHEDSFAKVPQLTYVWPTVDQFHPDTFALQILAQYLTQGKRAPLNEVLIDEQKLTSNVSSFQYGKEIAGEFYLRINANAEVDLDALAPAIDTALQRFETNGIGEADLARIKAGLEVSFYNRLQSALGKAIQLAQFNILADDPNRVNTNIQALKAVSTGDVQRVYNAYIKDRPFVATSFVPKGQLNLALAGAIPATVVQESIVQGAEAEVNFDPTVRNFERTPSRFDRSIEPDFGAPYTLPSPKVWSTKLANGLNLLGVENNETPLVVFSLAIDAGRDRNSAAKPAVASLTADMLLKGTASKSAAEFEDAVNSLGSRLDISADRFGATISGQSLARNFGATMALVEEMLIEPRWDLNEFDLLKRKQSNQIDLDSANPNAIASREYAKLSYPSDHVFSYRAYGSKEKLQAINIDDLKNFHHQFYSPANATLRIVGGLDKNAVRSSLDSLRQRWADTKAPKSTQAQAKEVSSSKIYFYDIPGAKQSVLLLARPSLNALDPQYPLATAMNFLLGSIYTSRLNTELRVNKGYTYGIRSRFDGDKDRGSFSIFTSVRSNVTLESLQLIKSIVGDYGDSFTEDDLATLKSALLRGQALQNETLNAKLQMLENISDFGYAFDYQQQHAKLIESMTLEQFKALAKRYLRPDAMNYLVIGDAKTQMARLPELGFGAPVLLNP